jgi:peptidyl-prolyl cis-trans isomerase SurA
VHNKLKNILFFVLFCATCAFIFSKSVYADDAKQLGIAAVVNDEVITFYDLQKRAMLVIGTSGMKDDSETRSKLLPQVLRALIDEKIKMQEAAKNNIEVTDAEIEKAINFVAKQNNVTVNQLNKKIEKAGLGIDVLKDQIRPEIAWMSLIGRKLGRNIMVSSEEADDIISKLEENKDKPKRLVSEIFLPVEDPAEDEKIRDIASQMLDQIKRGVSFAAMARQFSQSPTAANGGDMEWVFAGQLEQELEDALDEMEVGQVAGPIRAIDGYHILFLRAEHGGNVNGKAVGGEKYYLSRIVLPKKSYSSVLKKASAAKSCNVFNALAKKSGASGSGYIGVVAANDLSSSIKNAIKDLPIGKASKPIKIGDDKMIMMVCNKQNANKMYSIPSKEVITNKLRAERLEMHARRYLRDLRREAIIDIRL